MNSLTELKDLGRFVVVIGLPATGKSTLAESIANQFDRVVHTDTYIKYGFDKSLYECIKYLRTIQHYSVLVEGVQCYRLLRKIWQTKCLPFPGAVIECTAAKEERVRRLLLRKSDATRTMQMDDVLRKIQRDWIQLTKNHCACQFKHIIYGN